MLGAIFYLTIAGANVPSSMLANFFGWIEGYITLAFATLHAPDWLHGMLVLGLYRGTTWVISVMLPPMAIFFPAFALLENYGYLPRVAFNMDRLFKSVGAHGKQSLTMAMGFGCNAAAVISSRIIESPRERMLSILTNNLCPMQWKMGDINCFIFFIYGYRVYRADEDICNNIGDRGFGYVRYRGNFPCFLVFIERDTNALYVRTSTL
jgi:ferrous iron transport protein B